MNYKDNTEEVLLAFDHAIIKALEECGQKGETYAKGLAPKDTGNLQNSIAHKIRNGGKTVEIGSAVKYAPYVEFGTGKYVAGGRPTPWVYKDGQGNWHRTSGAPPKPYIKPAVADHADEYKRIIQEALKNG